MLKSTYYLGLTLLIWLLAACSNGGPPLASPTGTANLHPTVEIKAQIASTETAVPRWQTLLSGPVNVTPALLEDLVITATADGTIHAVEAVSGHKVWDFKPDDGRLWDASLRAAEGKVCVGLEGGLVTCLDARRGVPLWATKLGQEVQSRIALEDGRLYVPTTFGGTGTPNDFEGQASLFALDARDGQRIWEAQTENYILRRPIIAGSMVITGGAFVGDTQGEYKSPNRIYALAADTGDPIWVHESDDGLIRWIVGTGDIIAFAGRSEIVRALDPASGELMWSFGPSYWMQFPAINDGNLYLGSGDERFHGLSGGTGSKLWEQSIDLDSLNQIGQPIIQDDLLWFNAVTGDIYGLRLSDGQQMFHLETGVSARVGGVLTSDLYILGDPEGMLRAFEIGD